MKHFTYERLPTLRWIRLVEILEHQQPGLPFSFQLHPYPIDEAPTYEALSYTWGCPLPNNSPSFHDQHTVSCNGRAFSVNTNLHEALVQLHQPYDIDFPESYEEKTPLHRAVETRQTELVKDLISRGADVNAIARDGCTPLRCAAGAKWPAGVRILLSNGADPSLSDHQGLTPVARARQHNDQGLIDSLMTATNSHEDDLVIPGDSIPQVLLDAMKMGDLRHLTQLFISGYDVNHRDHRGRTLYHLAASEGDLGMMKFLIESGADPRSRDIDYQYAYDHARKNGHTEATRWIWENQECPDAVLRRQRKKGPRKLWRPKYIWVDAISINQDDVEERSTQVKMMSDIYKSASCVRVWFGRRESTSRELSVINSLASLNGLRNDIQDHFEPFTREESEALLYFFRRKWFRRSWILQEFLLGRQVICHCGDEQVSWFDIFNALVMFDDWSYQGKRQWQEKQVEEHIVALRALRRLQVLREHYSSKARLMGDEYHPLSTLVAITQEFECHDAHDKIYSLLGIAKITQHRKAFIPSPDYTLNAVDVYCTAARMMIRESRSLSILEFGQGTQLKRLEVPSWVPFEAVSPPLDRINAGDAKYCAGGRAPVDIDLGIDLQSPFLTVQAIQVSNVSSVEKNTVYYRYAFDLDWLSIAMHPEHSLPKQASRADLLWHTIMGGQSVYLQSQLFKINIMHQQSRGDNRSIFRNWVLSSLAELSSTKSQDQIAFLEELQKLDSIRKDNEDLFPSTNEVINLRSNSDKMLRHQNDNRVQWLSAVSMAGRNMFATNNGFLGKGPLSTRIGDIVFIVPGSGAPLLLREGTNGRFKVIGDSYIHGMMNSEILSCECHETRNITLE